MFCFLDTEFTDFDNCDLMSIGLVSEDGKHEFYQEVNDYTAEFRSQFVIDVVMPLMDRTLYGKSYSIVARDLSAWIDSLPADNIDVIVDYTKDTQHMVDLLNIYPPNKKVRYYFIKQMFRHVLIERGLSSPNLENAAVQCMVDGMTEYFLIFEPQRQHHALVDAKSNRHGWLRGLEYANAPPQKQLDVHAAL